jgi:parallel beta-helix repeat protein
VTYPLPESGIVDGVTTGRITHTYAANKKLNAVINIRSDFGAVGNGTTDDTAAINSAITAANTAGGGVVVVPPSANPFIFKCPASGGSGIIMKSNVTLLGMGGVLKLQDNNTVGSFAFYPIDATSLTNAHLVNLRVNGNRAGGNTEATVADCITMLSCTYSSVEGCRIDNAPDSGIMFSRNANSMLLNNYVYDWFDCGFYVNDGDGTNMHECLIDGNTFNGNGYTNAVSAIGLKRISQRVTVTNNTIYNCRYGITLEHASTSTDFSTNQIIANNFIRHVQSLGINLRGSDYVVCNGNRVEDAGLDGIQVEGCRFSTISDNVINECGTLQTNSNAQGIRILDRIDALSHASEDLVVANNIIRNTGGASIRLESGSATYDNQRIMITGNNCSGGTHGVFATADNNIVGLIGNILQGSTAAISNSATNSFSSGNRNVGTGAWV